MHYMREWILFLIVFPERRRGTAAALALAAAILTLACILLGASPAQAQATTCRDTPEGRICTVQQPITNATPVSAQTQRDLGLVTVGGGCSGTLINQYWVLTADHCVNSLARVPSAGAPCVPDAALNNVVITAAWSTERVIPTRLVRNWCGGGLDIALVYLGAGDFGAVNIQLLSLNELESGNTVVKYGQGLSSFATAGPPPRQAAPGGVYRSAVLSVSSPAALTYTLAINATNQIGHGGDSGGPDILLAPNGVSLGIAGVQSTCFATGVVAPNPLFLPSGAVNWPWVTGISSCNSAPIVDARFDIIQISAEKPANLVPVLYLLGGS
jgi:hypothetical protein